MIILLNPIFPVPFQTMIFAAWPKFCFILFLGECCLTSTFFKMAALQRSINILHKSASYIRQELFTKGVHKKKLKLQCSTYCTSKKKVPPISTVNGETIVSSPYEDLSLPQCTFAEYVFGELDKFSDLALMVSSDFSRFMLDIFFQVYIYYSNEYRMMGFFMFDWVLMSLFTIFQSYRGGQSY